MAQTCQPNLPVFNVTLSAGTASGSFWKLGRVKNVNHCGQLCCYYPGCDLAFSVDDICYNVKCHSEELCQLRKKNFSRHQVAVTLVSRKIKEVTSNQTYRTITEEDNKGKDKGEDISFNELDNKYESHLLSTYQNEDKGIDFESQNSFPTKVTTRQFISKMPPNVYSDLATKTSDTCSAAKILDKVTFRSGLKSGDFSDYGEVSDMNACVKHCCAQKSCDVSLLLNNHCYTLHCYKPELCKTIPAHGSPLESKIAFVVRQSSADRSKTRVKKTSSSNRGLCPHGAIFRDVSLKGGKKAGNFQILAGARDMRSCIQKCCENPKCQVAWLLGDHCYSVACYDKCITVKKRPGRIHSQLTLLTRKPQQLGNDKRQDIPGAKGSSGKEFTVFLTITDRVFTDNLKDIESLEFLNLAEKLQVAIGTVFMNAPSLQPEVISFRSSPVVAELKLTAKPKTLVSDVLKPLIATVKAGLLKSSIDGIPISFKLSEAGFRFVTSSGSNLVCGPEHDYDINWKLAMFNTTDSRICPRKAQGKSSRFCAGNETQNATWQDPNFSECVSHAYQILHQESKDLADRAAKKLPFAKVTATQIITRLEKLVFSDTYRDKEMIPSLADQHKNIRAAKKSSKGSRPRGNSTLAKKLSKLGKKEKDNFLPVTEIPRASPETIPTGTTQKVEDHSPVWFSDSKTKKTALNITNALRITTLNHPITDGHVLSTPRAQAASQVGMPVTESSVPFQDSNRVPTQAPPLQRPKAWGITEFNPRSRIQNGASSSRAMAGPSQIGRTLNISPIRNVYRTPNQVPNRRLRPYPYRSYPYRFPGNQAWQGHRAVYPNAWARGYPRQNYPSEQLNIRRRKRDVALKGMKRRQNTFLYNAPELLPRYNNLANRGLIPSSNFQGQRNYLPQNPNPFSAGYQRSPYVQSRGMVLSPAEQQPIQVQNLRYGTEPGIFPGGHPAPVERWPSFVNPIPKPTLALPTQSTPRRVLASTKATIETDPTSRTLGQSTEIKEKIIPSKELKPLHKVLNTPPKKKAVASVHRANGSINKKPVLTAKKLKDSTSPSSKRNETHVVPMFGGDILLSVGVLKFLQKFVHTSVSAITETELKLFVNSSSHLLDLKNKQEWRNAQKHAKALYKRGINVLEDSSNWDWDESQKKTPKDSKIGPVVLDLVGTVQYFVMNASYRVPIAKPLLTKNILFVAKSIGADVSDPTRPMSFPNYSDPVVSNWSAGHDSVTMTPSIFESAALGKSVNVHLLTSRFKTIPQLLPLGHDSGVVLNSAVLSSTVNPALKGELNPPVKLVMAVLNSSLIKFDQQCVAWTPKTSPGSKGGEWSPKGCKMTGSNATHTICECNHMTDFAVLADTSKAKGVGSMPHPSTAVPSPGTSNGRSWTGIIFAILAVLLVILLLIILLFYWRKKRRNEDESASSRPRSRALRRSRSFSRPTAKASRSSSSKSDGASSPGSSHSSQFDEMIAARRRKMAQDKEEKARRAQEEGREDEEEDDKLLMKEKAMLFSDYHQPYHFLSNKGEKRREKPEKSRRSAMDEEGSDV
ncbi:uncharacterized protein [Montipora capricornis]|uniref:uncharacterized protein isoform X1 n=1 Tax=Montipora capricornis TaxID=246305 RepID=UPI0035F21830